GRVGRVGLVGRVAADLLELLFSPPMANQPIAKPAPPMSRSASSSASHFGAPPLAGGGASSSAGAGHGAVGGAVNAPYTGAVGRSWAGGSLTCPTLPADAAAATAARPSRDPHTPLITDATGCGH